MNTKYQILFRKSLAEECEFDAAKEYFNVVEKRTDVLPGSIVIPRYSALPYYKELQEDCENLGTQLINSFKQHRYVADLANWYIDLEPFTPKTWLSVEEALRQREHEGPFILKGETNSRKNLWLTHMYAGNKTQLSGIFGRLLDDSLIGQQNIYVREFEQFVTYGINCVSQQPITKEFRFFFYKNEMVAGGYYWANQPEVIEEFKPDYHEAVDFAQSISSTVCSNINFYVIDVAQKTDGTWRVVELNDGSMSGLGAIDPFEFYLNLSEVLKK